MITEIDLQDIKNLMFAYARYVDQREHDQLGQLFEKGVIKANRGRGDIGLSGAVQVREAYDSNNKQMPDGSAGTKHLVNNMSIDMSQQRTSTVIAHSYFSVFQATASLALQPIVMGRYRDSFVLDSDGWYFHEKIIYVDLVGNISEHLNLDL